MMSISKRDIIGGAVAAILVGFVLFSIFCPPSKHHYNPAENNKASHECHSSSVPVSRAPNNHKDTGHTNQQAASEERCSRHSGIAAQWKATDATNSAFWAGILGIWLVGWTLYATKQATRVSQITSERQLRAHIAVINISTTRPKNDDFGVVVHIEAKNVGSTTARNVKMFRCYIIGKPLGGDEYDAIRFKNTERKWGDIASGLKRYANLEIVKGDDFDWHNIEVGIEDGRETIKVYGWIEYEDIYGREHATFFSGTMTDKRPIFGHSFNVCEIGNEMT